MTNTLENKLALLPDKPGIYKMINSTGNIIYIGKSKCLKKRVKSYFVDSPNWEKVKKMVPFIHDIEYIVTDTNLEAMLLECELIKKEKPYFNVIMKNDERYVYLKINKRVSSQSITLVYKRQEDCYGPFRRKSILQNMLESLIHIYPIEKKEKTYIFGYHILPISMDNEIYQQNRNVLIELFSKRSLMNIFLKELEKKMKISSDELKYEIAAVYRNIIESFKYIMKRLYSYQNYIKKKIVVDLKINEGHKLFFITKGYIVHKQIVEYVTEENKKEFLKFAIEKSKSLKINLDDKSYIDYFDIIYTELKRINSKSIEVIK